MFRSAANLERHNDPEVTFCGPFCDESRVSSGETIAGRRRGLAPNPTTPYAVKVSWRLALSPAISGLWNLEAVSRLYIRSPALDPHHLLRLRLELVLMQCLAFGGISYFAAAYYGSRLLARAPAKTGSAHPDVRRTVVE
jgi:hypothetical protein